MRSLIYCFLVLLGMPLFAAERIPVSTPPTPATPSIEGPDCDGLIGDLIMVAIPGGVVLYAAFDLLASSCPPVRTCGTHGMQSRQGSQKVII